MSEAINLKKLRSLIQNAKIIAEQFYKLTGKPLGITGEIGEFTAANLLKLKLTKARQPGYDAISRDGQKIQIKTRRVLPASKKGQRIGTIKLDYPWDEVVLVLLDEHFEPISLYKAARKHIKNELNKPGSKARNQRGQLSISGFKRIAGNPVWKK